MTQKRQPPRHGTHSCYAKGCRCEPCRVAHKHYERARTRAVRREKQGIEPRPVKYIDPTEAAAHLKFLRSRGMGLVAISHKTGIDKSHLQKLGRGTKTKLSAEYANKILAVPAIPVLGGQYVSADEAKQLMSELRQQGYYVREIAKALGQKSNTINLSAKVRYSRLLKLRQVHAELMRKSPR